jgi:hypothetical protein
MTIIEINGGQMKIKSVVKYVLLLFIALSIAFLVLSGGGEPEYKTTVSNNSETGQQNDIKDIVPDVMKQVDSDSNVRPASENASKANTAPPKEQVKIEQKPENEKKDLILAYYFHGNFRCHTCRTIEALAYKTVNERFAVELQSGEMIWKEINVEQPENRHFIDEFQLYSSSLVIVKKDGEKTVSWKILQDVWRLVKDENKFTEYVAKEIRAFRDSKI